MRTFLLAIALIIALEAGNSDPLVRLWLINPAAGSITNPDLRAVLPNVQAMHVDERFVYVESAGLALQTLSPLDANDREPVSAARKFVFQFPLRARPAEGNCATTPVGIAGAFLNGVPLYSPVSVISYRDQNLWHLDAVAGLENSARQHGNPESPLVESLLHASDRHSPLIGFALDGFPIYGPYGWDEHGKVRHFRSSYRLRALKRRTTLPGGAELSPSQAGPPVSAEFPLGMFAEDYEYAPGSGDLDEHNGRLARTPEYPAGTYAYFLATGMQDRPAYPYLVGASYFGCAGPAEPLNPIVRHLPLDQSQAGQIDLTTPAVMEAGQPAALTISIRDASGQKIHFLEKIHEQPIHLLVFSDDLAEFAHLHPEIQSDDTYKVGHSFGHGGSYWLFADYTMPGMAPSISRFRLSVKGEVRPAAPLLPDKDLSKSRDGLAVKLTLPAQLRANQDLTFRFDVSVDDLDPYLGAWAHISIVSEDHQEFIHAHPLDDPMGSADTEPWRHNHTARGPSPTTVSTITGFRRPGLYRLWVQFQRRGEVVAIPYTIKVEPEEKELQTAVHVPDGAIRVRVSQSGFEPALITLSPGGPAVLAFERSDAQNCASSVLFPELGIRKSLPVGKTVLIEIPYSGPRELHFACGMNMYRGVVVIR